MTPANESLQGNEWLLPVLEVVQNDIDLQNTVIAGYVRLLLSGRVGDLAEKQREILLHVQAALEKARQVTRQVKVFRDLEKGTDKFDGRSIELTRLLEGILAALPALPDYESTVKLETGSPDAQVFGDWEQLHAALFSLLRRMWSELPRNREVKVRITQKTWNGRSMMWVTVAANDQVDAVEGMAVKERNVIDWMNDFDLLLAQRIVAAHGGCVWRSAHIVTDQLWHLGGFVIALPEFVPDEPLPWPSTATISP